MPPSKLLLLLIAGAGALCAQVRFEDIKNSPSENWLLYAGDYAAQRHSPLKEINRDNVASLVAKWVYHVEGANRLSSIPLVFEGVMYVSNNNEVYALDAVSGRKIWHYRQPGVEMDRVNRAWASWATAFSSSPVIATSWRCIA